MDRYLFEKFVFEMDDALYEDSCIAFAKMAKNIVRMPDEKKVTFNYYPYEQERLQLVVEGTMEQKTAHIERVKMHHTSEDVWKLKIVTPISSDDGSYLATRPDGNGLIAVRLVNEQVLGPVTQGRVIEAQIAAFAVDIQIYHNEKEYADSVKPSADGKKLLMKDGLVVAANYLANNAAALSAEERQNKDHRVDGLVDLCGTITKCYHYPLNLLGQDLNSYYLANVKTDFGDVKIIIARSIFPKGTKGFAVGNLITGTVLLSGDVCIYDYEKYAAALQRQD